MLLIVIAMIWASIDLIARIKRHSKENSSKKETLTLIGEIAVLFLFALGIAWIFATTGADYYVDYRDNSPAAVTGIVNRIRRNDDADYYEAYVLTDADSSVVLKIHPSVLDEYQIAEGRQYSIQYFPRSYALCSLIPLD